MGKMRAIFIVAVVLTGMLFFSGASSITFQKPQRMTSDERLELLENSCAQQRNQQKSSDISLKNVFHHMLVNDEHGILYCYIPKVACSNWKRVMSVLEKKGNDTNQITSVDHKNGFKRLSSYSLPDIQYRLKAYFKFMFVREPLQRLVSAYKDKLTGKSEYYTKHFGDTIVHKFRPFTRGNSVRSSFPTLEEFFLHLQSKHPLAMDEHWMPMNKLCQPCVIRYDFIGSLENIDQDSKEVLEILNLSSIVQFPRQQMMYKNRTGPSTKELLNQTPKNLIKRILRTYSADYQLFNYSLPDVN